MSWIEIVLITIGMSLDTFAAVECQGALVAKLEKKRLSMAVTVIALWQTIALLIGSFLVTLLNQYDTQLSGEAFIGRILAILILFGMGLRMFVKAWRNERIVEKRLYTGYRLGFEQKSKAYIGGGALLIAAGIDVIVRYIVMR